MARLTDTSYLKQHHQLKKEWHSDDGGAFALLTASEQWHLHEFYEFTKDLSDGDLLVYRSHIAQVQPSLPQRAGKAIAALAVFSDRLVEYRKTPHPNNRKKGAPYEIRIFSEVNPDLDPAEFARILIDMARERARGDRAA